MSTKDGNRLPHRRISIYFNFNENICQEWQVLFFVPGVIRVFLYLFLWDLGGEPYGREQNQGGSLSRLAAIPRNCRLP